MLNAELPERFAFDVSFQSAISNQQSAISNQHFKDTRGEDIDHDFTERTTFIVTPDGKIAATLSSADDKVTPAQHDEKSLAVVQDLKGAK